MNLYQDQDYYFVMMNGEPIQPKWGDMLLDYPTAETVKDFLEGACPNDTFEIVKAVFIDDDKPQRPKRQNTANLRVLA